MNGRCFFLKFGKAINIVVRIVSILPDFLLHFLFDLISSFPGKLIVLFRYILIKSISDSIGNNLYIGRYVIIKNIKNITIGDNVSIHDFCYIDCTDNVIIGSNVSIAHSSSIISFEHGYMEKNTPIKYNILNKNKIIIKDDVWVGCGCRILAGTIINNRVIVGANSITKGILEEASIYVGSPAQKVKDI